MRSCVQNPPWLVSTAPSPESSIIYEYTDPSIMWNLTSMLIGAQQQLFSGTTSVKPSPDHTRSRVLLGGSMVTKLCLVPTAFLCHLAGSCTISCLYLVQYVISLMTNPVSTFRSVFKTTDKFSEHGLSVVFCWSLLSGSPGASIFLADATTYQIAICTLSRRPELVFSNFWSWPRENWLWQFHLCCIYSKRHCLMPTNTSSRS